MVKQRWEEWWEIERFGGHRKTRQEQYTKWYDLKAAHIKLMEEAYKAGYEQGKKDEYYTGCDV
jgi:hypothetical protein